MIASKLLVKHKIVNNLIDRLGDNPSPEEMLKEVISLIEETQSEYDEMLLAMKCAKELRNDLAKSVQFVKPAPQRNQETLCKFTKQLSLH